MALYALIFLQEPTHLLECFQSETKNQLMFSVLDISLLIKGGSNMLHS